MKIIILRFQGMSCHELYPFLQFFLSIFCMTEPLLHDNVQRDAALFFSFKKTFTLSYLSDRLHPLSFTRSGHSSWVKARYAKIVIQLLL